MSNLPSNEELQRLLDQATPGPWSTIEERYTDRDGKPIYHPDGIVAGAIEDDLPVMWNSDGAVDWTSEPGNPRLAALAPVLAAEVIRLREENDEMRRGIATAAEKARSHATQCSSMGQAAGSLGHRDVARHLTRILEGDQT